MHLYLYFAIACVACIAALSYGWKIREGFESEDTTTTAPPPTSYQSYDSQDPLILARQNAGNISYLKERVAALDALDAQTKTQQQQLDGLQQQVDALTAQQAQYASDLAGDEPIELQGMDDDVNDE